MTCVRFKQAVEICEDDPWEVLTEDDWYCIVDINKEEIQDFLEQQGFVLQYIYDNLEEL